jgi:arsenate reductase
MKRIYYLSTCSTCKNILREKDTSGFEMVDIKKQAIEADVLDKIAEKSGSYKHFFNTRAQKLKDLTPEMRPVSEKDIRKLILSDYTYLRRPLVIADDIIVAGSDKHALQQIEQLFSSMT